MKRIKLILLTLLIGATLIPPLSSRAGLEEGLVGYWSFDEGSGIAAADTSGNGNDGTVYGATWVDGKIGKALKFDGVDDYMKINDDEDLNFSLNDDFAISFWVKVEGVPSIAAAVIDKRLSNTQGYQIILLSNGKLKAMTDAPKVGGKAVYSSAINDGNWYHIVFVREATVELRLYTDGILESTARDDATETMENSKQLDIGYDTNSYGTEDPDYFNGFIDEVRIYNKTLSAQEILDISLEGLTSEEIEAQIAKRQEQIAQLQAQITKLQALLSESTIPGIPEGYEFTTYLYSGKRGDDVRYLQEFLKAQGSEIYPEALVTGYYGRLTTLAVARFQIKHGVVSSMWSPGAGHAGPKTRAKINELLGY